MDGKDHNPVSVCKLWEKQDKLVCSQAVQPCGWLIKQHDLCQTTRNSFKIQVNEEQMA